MTTIFFDMDGTIADLYGVQGWLEQLTAKDATPYEIAKPLVKMNVLARTLNELKRQGYRVAIISWLAKNSTDDYDIKVTKAKEQWLHKHLGSVTFDEINIVSYGTPKEQFAHTESDILFDDELHNRKNWTGKAYDVNRIIETLKAI